MSREATWGLVWAFATVNPPEPRALVEHAFVADSSSPLCQPAVPGAPGPFVETSTALRCKTCSAAVAFVVLELAEVRALRAWAWVAWEPCTGRAFRGTAATRAEAETAGREAIEAQIDARAVAVTFFEGTRADRADEYARELRAEAKAKAPPAPGAGTAPTEHLFRSVVDWDFARGLPVHRTISARVLRTTTRLTFVEQHMRATEGGAVVVSSLALDRAALDRGESVRGWSRVAPTEAEIAALLARYGLREDASPGWATVLGVDFPCSADEARRAYRRAARSAHPDAGGTAESFRAVTEAHEQATSYFASRGAA